MTTQTHRPAAIVTRATLDVPGHGPMTLVIEANPELFRIGRHDHPDAPRDAALLLQRITLDAVEAALACAGKAS